MRYRQGSTPPPLDPDALPPTVEDYLSSGAPEGERNARLFGAACQLRDIGRGESEALDLLVDRASSDGLSESEIRTTIRSVFAQPAREAPARGGVTPSGRRVREYRLRAPGEDAPIPEPERPRARLEGSQPVPLPKPIEDGFCELLRAAFEEGEKVCIARTKENAEGERKPESGVTLTREQWIDKVRRKGGIEKVFTTQHGLFIRVNPMDGEGVGNANVTRYRHALVEFDSDLSGARIPKPDQLGMILASNLPITAILDSGNKSVHAWVRVDAESQEEYDERVDEVYSLFSEHHLDRQNRNASRLSRAPGAPRLVDGKLKAQTLLKTNVGAKSWDDWKQQQETAMLGSPVTVDYLLDYDVENDPNNLIGNRWLCKGGSLVIVSQAGVGKSTLTAQFSIGWGLGRSDLSFGITPVRPLKSLILQAENDDGDLAEMMQGVFAGFSLSPEDRRRINENLLFHRITDKTGAEFIRVAEALVNLHRPDLLWIDPLLNFIGADINDQREIASFCATGLNGIAARTGVVNILIHHMGKPPKDAKAWSQMTASDLAYAGLGSSALTNWAREVVAFRRLGGEGLPTFELTATKRRRRAGMRDPETREVVEQIYIQHSGEGMSWRQCNPPAEEQDDQPRGRDRRREPAPRAVPNEIESYLRTMFQQIGPLDASALEDAAEQLGVDLASISRFARVLGVRELH